MSAPVAARAFALSTLLVAGAAHAEQPCAGHYVKAQELRLDKKLRASREQLVACAQKSCPAFMQAECARWLTEVDAALPTVVVDVRDASGHAVVGGRLLVDGEVRQTRIDGASIAVDPGEHMLRVETAEGAASARLLVHEGAKDRPVVVTLPAAPSAIARAAAPAEREPRALVPWPAYALGGVAAVALGTFAYFAISGYAMQLDMKHGCSPYCPESRMTSLRQKYLAADISLGVAAVAAGAALWIALSRRSDGGVHVAFDARSGGATGSVVTSF